MAARLGGFFRRLTQSDEERLTEDVRAWADSIPDTQRIGEAAPRTSTRVCGMVRRLTVRPLEGQASLAVVVDDGTGEVTAVWSGRDEIPGLRLGTRMAFEGMLGTERDGSLRMVNPRYEFL